MDKASQRSPDAKQVENIVLMEDISSSEHFVRAGEEPRKVLAGIDLLIKRGQTWGINAGSLFEIKLLLEIMANIRPYDSGRCVLIERGMLRHKRIILQHVFYIGSSDMLYINMNVLEFLVFSMSKLKSNRLELQEEIFEFVISAGLGSISLSPVRMLTREERAVVTLLAAAHSDSMTIVLNLPEYDFDELLTSAIAKISGYVRDRGKTLIIGTQNSLLIEKACSHTAYIADGGLIFRGTVDQLRSDYDKIVIVIRDKNVYSLLDKLAALLPGYTLSIKNGVLIISNCGKEESDPGYIYKKIAEADFAPDYMEINRKTVQNAYEELVFQHDLQK